MYFAGVRAYLLRVPNIEIYNGYLRKRAGLISGIGTEGFILQLYVLGPEISCFADELCN
jgi:hypothetical protein